VLDIFRGNGNTLVPRQVSVQVVDARGEVSDTSARADTLLVGRGFRVNGPVRQAPDDLVEPRTVIRYSADQRNAALLLSRYLAGFAVYQEVTGLRRLELTLGADYAGVLAEPRAENDLIGVFPGLGGVNVTTLPPATSSTAAGGATGATPTVGTATTAPAAPTTTSGIIGRPPEGVACR
jgi:hypothetical protein